MAYQSFRDELEAKIESWDVTEIQELDGKVLVEFFGDPRNPPGSAFADCHGLSKAGILTGEQAQEAGAKDGHNIVVFSRD